MQTNRDTNIRPFLLVVLIFLISAIVVMPTGCLDNGTDDEDIIPETEPESATDMTETVDSGDFTVPGGTYGDVTIDGDTDGLITLGSDVVIEGDLTVNTPHATVDNHAQVDGTINIDAVAPNTWNQYGDANQINVNAENATVNLISGTINQEVTVTQRATIVASENASIPSITITAGAEGSHIGGTYGGDLNINGDTDGLITLGSDVVIEGDLTVNTPHATVDNHAQVDGTINIDAVAPNTWNQYGDANQINANAENATVNLISGTINQEVTVTQRATVVASENASIPSITITAGAEGSHVSSEVEVDVNNDGVEITVEGLVNASDKGKASEALETIKAKPGLGSSGGSSDSSTPDDTPDDLNIKVESGDETIASGTYADGSITGESDGTLTIEDVIFEGNLDIDMKNITTVDINDDVTIEGDLTVNTPNATVNNEATVDGDIDIDAVSTNTWNQNGGSANNINVNAEGATVNLNNTNVPSVTINVRSNLVSSGSTGTSVSVTDGADGAHIESDRPNVTVSTSVNISVAGSINASDVDGEGTVDSRTARGNLELNETLVSNDELSSLKITYTLGENLSNGNVNISIPGDIYVHSAENYSINVDDGNVSFGSGVFNISNVANGTETIELSLSNLTEVTGNHVFSFSANATKAEEGTSIDATSVLMVVDTPESFEFDIRQGSIQFELSEINNSANEPVDLSKLEIDGDNSKITFLNTSDDELTTFNFSMLGIDEPKQPRNFTVEDMILEDRAVDGGTAYEAFIDGFLKDKIDKNFTGQLSGTYDGLEFSIEPSDHMEFTNMEAINTSVDVGIGKFVTETHIDTDEEEIPGEEVILFAKGDTITEKLEGMFSAEGNLSVNISIASTSNPSVIALNGFANDTGSSDVVFNVSKGTQNLTTENLTVRIHDPLDLKAHYAVVGMVGEESPVAEPLAYSFDSNTLTATYNQSNLKDYRDSINNETGADLDILGGVRDDFARYFKSLNNAAGVSTIQYNETDYTWNESKGHFEETGDLSTLVSAAVEDAESEIIGADGDYSDFEFSPYNFTIDGEELTVNLESSDEDDWESILELFEKETASISDADVKIEEGSIVFNYTFFNESGEPISYSAATGSPYDLNITDSTVMLYNDTNDSAKTDNISLQDIGEFGDDGKVTYQNLTEVGNAFNVSFSEWEGAPTHIVLNLAGGDDEYSYSSNIEVEFDTGDKEVFESLLTTVEDQNISDANVSIEEGSIVFNYTFFNESGEPISYSDATGSPYDLNTTASTVMLYNDTNGSDETDKISLQDIGEFEGDGNITYQNLTEVGNAFNASFSEWQGAPTHIVLNLTGGHGEQAWDLDKEVEFDTGDKEVFESLIEYP
ncbi:beta strand repeat-containing protein [Methanohalophilus mahii]|uniref:Uncharacterized protein n=1 Tax=Methanohalophilus mahii (strain ATCC 35705 / DSM 5219 / SLP) TaxID=547558 RepID=D5E840_METMS|nr:hypothetical protein [Methanohalophilus mahii]ADE37328.1 hypothetical protein Mmah_1833 [Methanohalophilus mahii DSM 5219]